MSVRYSPSITPYLAEELPPYIKAELNRVSSSVNDLADGHIDKTHVEPSKPRTGDKRYADGSDWNPGQGEGLYFYDGTEWIPYGNSSSGVGDFGQFADMTVQSCTAVNTATPITWGLTGDTKGISVDDTITSRINFTHSGKYYVDFSCLLHSESSNSKEIWVFPRINGVDVTNSGIHHTLAANDHKRTLSKAGIFSINAGDYLEAVMAVDDLDMDLHYEAASAFAPATPSATLSITQIGG